MFEVILDDVWCLAWLSLCCLGHMDGGLARAVSIEVIAGNMDVCLFSGYCLKGLRILCVS